MRQDSAGKTISREESRDSGSQCENSVAGIHYQGKLKPGDLLLTACISHARPESYNCSRCKVLLKTQEHKVKERNDLMAHHLILRHSVLRPTPHPTLI